MATSLIDLLAGSSTPEKIIVQSGDTLSKIADRTGVSVEDLARINQIANPNLIGVGQEISTGNELRSATLLSGVTSKAKELYEGVAGYANPIKVLLRYVAGSEAPISRDTFSEEGLEVVRQIAKQGGARWYNKYHDLGGGYTTGNVQERSLGSNAAADEVALILGRFTTRRNEDGSVSIVDKYDFEDKKKNLERAVAREELGASAMSLSSRIQAYAPSIRNIIRRLTFRDESDAMPVDITFTPEEMRR
jgi:LysM repeat protein